jgi:8-oxo-dGTP pyrophosphatase MutT (NUDIX family)
VSETVRAAGGLVTRSDPTGAPEVLLVHRPRYDDWTFPKGKALPAESDEDTAVREVEEETGLRCELEDELPSTVYRDLRGRQKVVRYWRMRPVGGQEHVKSDEVDELAWVPLEEADLRLTYDRDRQLLQHIERAAVR